MTASTYRDYQVEKAPVWLRGEFASKWWELWGDSKDALLALAKEAVRQRYPSEASPGALEAIGHDRQLERMPDEGDVAYIARLEQAFDLWQWAGTRQGVRDALIWTRLFDPQHSGDDYTSPDVVEAWRWPGGDGADATQICTTLADLRALTEHVWFSVAYVTDDEKRWAYDPLSTDEDDGSTVAKPDDVTGAGRWIQRGRWARFWVVITQPHVFGPPFLCGEVDDGGDGRICGDLTTICGYTEATAEQGQLLSRQARIWKGGHNRGESIVVIGSGGICGGGWKCGEEGEGGDGIICGGTACYLPIS